MGETIEQLKVIIKQQLVYGEKIENLFVNFKQDARAKTDKDRALKYARKANNNFQLFAKNHAVLFNHYDKISDYTYFAEKYAEEVERDYNKLKKKLTAFLTTMNLKYPELNETSEPYSAEDDDVIEQGQPIQNDNTFKGMGAAANGSSTPKIEEPSIVVRISSKVIFFQDFINELEDYVAAGQISKVQVAKPMLSNHFEQLMNEYELYCIEDFDDIDQVRQRISSLRERYLTLLEKTNTERKFVGPPEGIKLKPIEIEPFDGDYTKWPTFEQLFTSFVINNKQYENFHRMQYLKASVTGEALNIIFDFDIDGKFFEPAWNLLKKKFSNKKAVRNMHLDLFMNQSSVFTESSFHLKKLHDTSRECISLLQSITTEHIFVYILRKKLDKTTHTLYEQSLDSEAEETVNGLLEFIEKRYRVLEMVNGNDKRNKNDRSSKQFSSSSSSKRIEEKSKDTKCLCCEKTPYHPLHTCNTFKNMLAKERRSFVYEKKLCHLCLQNSGHRADNCFLKRGCSKCSRKHNDLLHFEDNESNKKDEKNKQTPKKQVFMTTTTETSESNESPINVDEVKLFYASNDSHDVMLATARIRIRTTSGWSLPFLAMLDQGATSTYITSSAANKLHFKITKNPFNITGLGGTVLASSKGTVDFQFTSHFSSNVCINVTAVVVNKTAELLTSKRNKHLINIPELKNLQLADPKIGQYERVDIILGSDVLYDIMTEGLIKPKDTRLLVQATEIGWIVSGALKKKTEASSSICLSLQLEPIDTLVNRFWANEEIEIEERPLSSSQEYCLQHFNRTIKRNNNGKYVVTLPFKQIRAALGNSKRTAMAQLMQLQRRFANDSNFKKLYIEFINEYKEMGHMKLCTTLKPDSECYYLPHHAVFKDSTTTKLRTVFNASSKTSTGVSLNDLLLIGPKIQDDLFNILTRFRTNRIAFTADIAKMYRQIELIEEHQNYHRILWINQETGKLEEYQLTTVTYGTSSAPFVAVQVIIHHANQRSIDYPEACEVIKKDSYVDDVTSGCDTVPCAMKLQREITSVLAEAGFPLRKWTTNNKEFLQSIPIKDREGASNSLSEFGEAVTTTLGVHWYYESDKIGFVFSNMTSNTEKITKRKMLSDIAKIYDPLGLIAPVTIANKILMQRLWSEELNWDDTISEEIAKKWRMIKEEMHLISKVRINRWIHYRPNSRLELHGFSDASLNAYGCCVYAKVFDGDKIHITLLAAKTRVAPLKNATLPKLELCGAHLLSSLIKKLKDSFGERVSEVKCYSDSKITLAWINSQPHRWKQFVATRVEHIQNIVESKYWSYVNTKENPADHASRGLLPSQLVDNKLWWYGPDWLLQNEVNIEREKFETTLMQKSDKKIFHISTEDELSSRFSSLTRATRVIALCLRFYKKCKEAVKNQNKTKVKFIGNEYTLDVQQLETMINSICFDVDELKEAKIALIGNCQRLHFEAEIKVLSAEEELSKSNSLKTLFPFVDGLNLLRVGGRLEKSKFNYNKKHPYIIPYHSNLARLIVKDAHQRLMHAGNQLTLAQTRHEFWIIAARRMVKTVINNCLTCFVFKSSQTTQLMGSLPEDRTKMYVKPFANCGTDMCGPFMTKISGERYIKAKKGYVIIFICLSTKAIHLELVSNQTSEAFLAAFKRLIARRGNVNRLYSDNGTNFTGTQSILALDSEKAINDYNEDICQKLIQFNTKFVFNPPGSPWFGGIWERNIGAMKHHLKRVIGDKKLTYEEFSTVLVQIESCLNSRPLCPISDNPDEFEALTPGHFLIGDSLTAPIESTLLTTKNNRLNRWELCTKMRQEFWEKWSGEYVSQLQLRTKWTETKKNLEVGDMVLMKEETTPPLFWPLGRIVNVYPGKDGLVRVADIKSNGKIYKRPVVKLAVLPVRRDENLKTCIKKAQSSTNSDNQVESRPLMHTKEKINVNYHTTKGKQVFGSSLITLIMFFGLLLSVLAEQSNVTVTPFNRNPGAIFNKCGQIAAITGKWNLIARMDMSNYYNSYDMLQTGLKRFESSCEKSKSKNITACGTLLDDARSRMITIHEKDALLKGNARDKRGALVAAMVGSLLSFAGTKLYDYFVEDSRTDERIENLEGLIDQHTSFFNLTENAIGQTQQSFYDELNDFANKTMEFTAREMETSRINNECQWIALQLIFLLTGFENIQNTMIENVGKAKSGIKLIWLTPERLHSHISLIDQHLPRNVKLYGDSLEQKMDAIYKLSTSNMILTKKEMVLIFEVPLFKSVKYDCYELIPIPSFIGKSSVQIDTSYSHLWMSKAIDKYRLVKDDEMRNCEDYNMEKICNGQHSMSKVNSNRTNQTCELSLYLQKMVNESHCATKPFENNEFWTRIDNSWIYSVAFSKISVDCDGFIEKITLNGSGLLKVKNGCSIQTDDYEIDTFDMTWANDTIDVHIGHANFSEKFGPEDQLKYDIGKFKHEFHLPHLELHHHVHHYVLIYSLIFGLILIGLLYWHCKRNVNIREMIARDIDAR